MSRFDRALVALLFFCAPAALLGQTSPNSGSSDSDDIKVLRQMIEQQSKQIDVLAQEIARLNLLLEGKTPSAQGLAPSPADSAPPPKALPAEAAEATEPAATPPAGPVHIVTKGETLTAIAKRYKVTVPDLLKVNKIADVRKLQIGQTLALPPGAKIPESPTPAASPQ